MTENKATIFPSFPLKSIKIPILSLPEDRALRERLLARYFQEVFVDCKRVKDNWNIDLFWPSSSEFYIDPKITEGVSEWASNVHVSDIPFSLKNYGKYQESLNDNWTLYAWGKWWGDLNQRKSLPAKIIILHLDDHEDFMSPKIYVKDGNLYDLLTNKLTSIHDLNSIKSAILSSSIGIGEFILPFLWEIPLKVEIRHLCERKRNNSPKSFSLELGSEPDLLQPKFQRLIAKLKPSQALNKSRISYFVTDNVSELLNISGEDNILLHIDLDYFNDRYDGCSSWREKKRIYDPQKELVSSSLKNFFEILKAKGLMPYIDNVAVCTSPGFFPCEYWSESLALIRSYVPKKLF